MGIFKDRGEGCIKMRKKMKRWLSLLFLTTILGSLVYVNRLMNLKTEAAEVVVESETEILLESETVTTEESTETAPAARR